MMMFQQDDLFKKDNSFGVATVLMAAFLGKLHGVSMLVIWLKQILFSTKMFSPTNSFVIFDWNIFIRIT